MCLAGAAEQGLRWLTAGLHALSCGCKGVCLKGRLQFMPSSAARDAQQAAAS